VITFAAVAVLAFVLGVLFHVKKVGKKAVPWLMVVASFGLAGVLGSVLDRLASSSTAGTTSATARLFGTAVPMVLAVVVIAYLAIHMKPKGQPPTRLTPWIALASVPILRAAGGVFASIASKGQVTMADVTTGVWAFLTDVVGGPR
jgi:hypothetical protein